MCWAADEAVVRTAASAFREISTASRSGGAPTEPASRWPANAGRAAEADDLPQQRRRFLHQRRESHTDGGTISALTTGKITLDVEAAMAEAGLA
jgi:hypothetical protein